MMKIDFSALILDLEDKPVKEGDKDVTFGGLCGAVCCATFADEQDLSGAEKYKRFLLAVTASKGGEQEVSAEDAALLKKLIAKAYAPLVVGRAYDIIEPIAS